MTDLAALARIRRDHTTGTSISTPPLSKLLKRLFASHNFPFLGFSLSADRTIQTFMRAAQLEGQENLPHHYALLACPTDAAKKVAIDHRLADAHSAPLWYP
jgi:SIR2-like domain